MFQVQRETLTQRNKILMPPSCLGVHASIYIGEHICIYTMRCCISHCHIISSKTLLKSLPWLISKSVQGKLDIFPTHMLTSIQLLSELKYGRTPSKALHVDSVDMSRDHKGPRCFVSYVLDMKQLLLIFILSTSLLFIEVLFMRAILFTFLKTYSLDIVGKRFSQCLE